MSNKLKTMLEKRNSLVDEMEEILEFPEIEERGLGSIELNRLEKIKQEVLGLDNTINKVKEIRSMNFNNQLTEITEENNMNNNNILVEETRGLEQYLRNQQGEERRALEEATTVGNNTEATAGNGGVTVPTSVHSEVIEKIGETSPLFESVRKFGSVTGNLKIAREDGNYDEGFIGETLDATKLKPTLSTVTLSQKRVGAAMQLTKQLVNDSGVDIVDYTTSILSRSVGKAVERGILIGAKTEEDKEHSFSPIIGDEEVETITFASDTPTIEELLDVYGSINPNYLDGAMFIVSRELFNSLLKLQDGDGTYLIFRDLVNGKPGYVLFNVPVYVSDVLNERTEQLVFGNFHEAYGMLINQNMNLTNVVADTTQALAGGVLSVLDMYADGAVINPDAVRIGQKLI